MLSCFISPIGEANVYPILDVHKHSFTPHDKMALLFDISQRTMLHYSTSNETMFQLFDHFNAAKEEKGS